MPVLSEFRRKSKTIVHKLTKLIWGVTAATKLIITMISNLVTHKCRLNLYVQQYLREKPLLPKRIVCVRDNHAQGGLNDLYVLRSRDLHTRSSEDPSPGSWTASP